MKSYKEQLREKLENFEYPYNDKAWTDFKRYRLKKYIPYYTIASVIFIFSIISLYIFLKNNERKHDINILQERKITVNTEIKQNNQYPIKYQNKQETSTKPQSNNTSYHLQKEKLSNQQINNNAEYTITTIDDILNEKNENKNEPENLKFYVSTTSGCVPLTVKFEAPNLTKEAGYLWNFGDGTTSTSPSTIHTYKKAGIYTVQLLMKTENNTEYTSEKQTIKVYTKPKAMIDISNSNNCLELSCKSKEITNYIWKLKDTIISNTNNVKYCYSKTETIPIQLIVINENECIDTLEKKLNVFYKLPVYFADAFTPDGDGINDVFGPQVSNYEEYYFDIKIFNKVGKCIFSKQGNNVEWDGCDVNTKMLCPPDAYFYKVLAVDKKGNKQEFSGKIQLIR